MEKHDCVIVGRCASFILKDRKDCLKVFVHADKDYRLERAIQTEKIEPGQAEDFCGSQIREEAVSTTPIQDGNGAICQSLTCA